MTERERLIELIQSAVGGCARHWEEVIADYLLDHGVIAAPCKVGDTVYVIWKNAVYPVGAYAIRCDFKKHEQRVCVEGTFHFERYNHNYSATFTFNGFGRTVFLTREEAEAALAERRKA